MWSIVHMQLSHSYFYQLLLFLPTASLAHLQLPWYFNILIRVFFIDHVNTFHYFSNLWWAPMQSEHTVFLLGHPWTTAINSLQTLWSSTPHTSTPFKTGVYVTLQAEEGTWSLSKGPGDLSTTSTMNRRANGSVINKISVQCEYFSKNSSVDGLWELRVTISQYTQRIVRY